ncbi:MAG TPA: TIGR01841 family phasin [Mesorhizobium sp.]
MAKKPEEPSFMDMFARFGRDLKLPNLDVDAIIEHQRRNFDALEKSARVTATGTAALMRKQRDMLEDTLRQTSEMAKHYKTPGNPEELIARHAEFARKAFESAVSNAGEVAELVKSSGTESIEILRNRIKEAMVEVREEYEKKK